MGLTLVGSDADETKLVDYLAHMPAGDYLGDQWRTEPLVLVDICDGTRSKLLEIVSAAFPFWKRSSYPFYLAVVPRTVARLLTWNQDEAGFDAAVVDVPYWVDDLAFFAELLAPLDEAESNTDMLVAWFDELYDTARDEGVPPLATVRLAADLARTMQLARAAEAAVLTLTRQAA